MTKLDNAGSPSIIDLTNETASSSLPQISEEINDKKRKSTSIIECIDTKKSRVSDDEEKLKSAIDVISDLNYKPTIDTNSVKHNNSNNVNNDDDDEDFDSLFNDDGNSTSTSVDDNDDDNDDDEIFCISKTNRTLSIDSNISGVSTNSIKSNSNNNNNEDKGNLSTQVSIDSNASTNTNLTSITSSSENKKRIQMLKNNAIKFQHEKQRYLATQNSTSNTSDTIGDDKAFNLLNTADTNTISNNNSQSSSSTDIKDDKKAILAIKNDLYLSANNVKSTSDHQHHLNQSNQIKTNVTDTANKILSFSKQVSDNSNLNNTNLINHSTVQSTQLVSLNKLPHSIPVTVTVTSPPAATPTYSSSNSYSQTFHLNCFPNSIMPKFGTSFNQLNKTLNLINTSNQFNTSTTIQNSINSSTLYAPLPLPQSSQITLSSLNSVQNQHENLLLNSTTSPSPPPESNDILKKNKIVYTLPRSNPTIDVEIGSIFHTKCDVIVNSLGCDTHLNQIIMTGNLTQQIINQAGATVRYELEQRKKLNVLHDRTNSIIVTSSGDLKLTNLTKCLFHAPLNYYDYTSDISEIRFKNTFMNILKLCMHYNYESIAIPTIGCGALMYPSTYVVKWFDECFKKFFLSYTCHSFKHIKIVIFENDTNIIDNFKNYFYNKENQIQRNLFNDIDKPNDEYKLTTLDMKSEEYNIVANHFKLTMKSVSIKRIEKVDNVFLETMYEQTKKMLMKRNPEHTPTEYKLFHGTDSNNVQSICRLGFNRSYCGKNGVLFGQGVYFARSAGYSDRYSRKEFFQQSPFFNYQQRNCSYNMILAKVLVGVYQLGSQEMKDTSQRPDGNQYDSTVDNIQNPTIFVTYRDYRAYPSYIIHYD